MGTSCPTNSSDARIGSRRFGQRRSVWRPRRRRAEAEQLDRDAATAQREAEGKSRRGKPPVPVGPTPEAKAQTNFTDPDAKIMKRSNKWFDYCYNAQAVVDSRHQINAEWQLICATHNLLKIWRFVFPSG